jgi:hypothetical protein
MRGCSPRASSSQSSEVKERWLSTLPFKVDDIVKVSNNYKVYELKGKIGIITAIYERDSNYRGRLMADGMADRMADDRMAAECVVKFGPSVSDLYREQGFLVEFDEPEETWPLASACLLHRTRTLRVEECVHTNSAA